MNHKTYPRLSANVRLFVPLLIVLVALMGTVVVAGATSAPRKPLLAPGPGQATGKNTSDNPSYINGTYFSYQGRLSESGGPANGAYDFILKLYDSPTGGNMVSTPMTITNMSVVDGLFTLWPDFGAQAFIGSARWLDISVRLSGSGSFTTLNPRGWITPVPYALGLAPGAIITSSLPGPLVTISNTWSTGLLAQSDHYNAITAISGSSYASGLYAENYGTGFGVAARNNSNSWDVPAVLGQNVSGGTGVMGSGGTYGIYGTSSSATQGAAVFGTGAGNGVEGHSTNSVASGVYGENYSGGFGVAARANSSGTALFADNYGHLAAYMRGNVTVEGTLSKGGGSFKIDDPIDPANKYLYHSFVESPDMMNIYNGNITTDSKGEATVTMPAWFEALNQDFRYQLTVIGQFAQAIVADEIHNNQFSIKTDKPNVKVSWQVTGIRHDPFANAHRIPVEENKAAGDKGKYLYPTEQGKPESQGIGYAQSQQLAKSASTPQSASPRTEEYGR